MNTERRPGWFARLSSLIRGAFGSRVADAEVKNAGAVYHRAIEEQQRQQERLRDAVAKMITLRNRAEMDLKRTQSNMQLVQDAAERAATDDNDTRALALLRKHRTLTDAFSRLESDHERLTQQVEQAKVSLREGQEAMAKLVREREEMLARKEHALAKRQAHSVLLNIQNQHSSATAALQNVRAVIEQLEERVEMETDGSFMATGEPTLAELSREAEERELHVELGALKLKAKGHLLAAGTERVQPFPETVAAEVSR